MIVYAAVFLLILIPLVRYDICGKKGYEGIWYYVLLFAFISLSALRYRTGGDTLIYMSYFEDYPTVKELFSFDFLTAEFNPMWYVYNSVFKSMGDSYFLFQTVQAIIVNSIILWFLYKHCNYFFISVMIYYLGYYFYFNMEVQREILCICVFLLSYDALVEHRYVKFYLAAFFALTIHVSAALLLIMPFFMKLEKDRLWLSLAVSLCLSLFLMKVDIVGIVLSTALGDSGNIVRSYLSLDAPNIFGRIVAFIACFPFMCFFYVREKSGIDCNKDMGALLNMVILIQFVGMFIQGPSRFSNYLMLIGIVFMVNTTFDNIQTIRKSQVMSLIICLGWFVYSFNIFHFYNKNTSVEGTKYYDIFVPYVSVFNPHEVEKRERLIINDRYEKEFFLHRGP